ncbi:Bifunctional protein BirA [Actinomyces bovis]|uniref:Bifunctional protein BirA n=1 Tax=Actinomyces bovis TaxID=1658 RepID=A0ABY1VMH7_9ACTO|nr:biotin--[acetyl-CoA-carboxylase] ligase [Actinomyces bovis]SPT53275.1 Bifunctional protein BirA [Actinomyces bovis]VEG52566.1 Bifunctional protein BirA [Actinomyces israelii]
MTSVPAHIASPWSRRSVVERTGSTNDDLRVALSSPDGTLNPASLALWPHLSVLRAQAQTAGRGRADHQWVTPPHGALLASIVLRPLVPAAQLAWLSLLTGLALRDALAPLVSTTAWTLHTKWPNDLVALPTDGQEVAQVEGWGSARKVAGVLTELVAPAGGLSSEAPARRELAGAVVVGIGVNLGQNAAELPVPWAASLRTLGVQPPAGTWDADAVLDRIGQALTARLDQWEAAGGDPGRGGASLGAQLREACITLGQQVRVTIPGLRQAVVGRVTDLEPGLVLTDSSGNRQVIAAGDVLSVPHQDVIWDTLAR